MLHRILIALVAAGLLVALLLYSQQRHETFHVSGFIEADEIRVGSRVGGRVQRVFVEEGAVVRAGDKLVELEPFDLQEQAARARAELAERMAVRDKLRAGYRAEEIAAAEARRNQLAAQLKKLKNGPREQEIRAAESSLQQAEAQLKYALERYKRIESLLPSRTATQAEMDQVVSETRVARTTQQVREAQLDLLRAGTRPEEIEAAQAELNEAEQQWNLKKNGFRPEEIAEAEAAVKEAEAALAAITTQLAELMITAPSQGTVEAIELQPGDLVTAGAAAMSIIDSSRLWVRAYVPENHLNVQVGQTVHVKVDSLPERDFKAHVSFVARQAEFTPGNVQTPEERSKQVFRIKAMLDEGLDVLRAGMMADVWFERPAPQQTTSSAGAAPAAGKAP